MTQAKFNLMVRVVKTRLGSGENLEKIIESYPGLTETEAQQIKNAVLSFIKK